MYRSQAKPVSPHQNSRNSICQFHFFDFRDFHFFAVHPGKTDDITVYLSFCSHKTEQEYTCQKKQYDPQYQVVANTMLIRVVVEPVGSHHENGRSYKCHYQDYHIGH